MPISQEVDRIRELLADKDFRLTPQREAILSILLRNPDRHLTAEDIYDITREEYPEIGLATVYRSLELFYTLGIVSRLDTLDGGSRMYEFISGDEKHYHHHLLCVSCGAILEFNEDLLEELEQKITSQSGFKIVDHSLRFFGYCQECVSKHAK